VRQLPSPVLDGQCGTRITSRISEGSDSPSGIVREELKIEKSTTTTGPAAQNLLPTTLLLVTMRKGDMNMLKGEVILGELLETQDEGVLGGILHPRAFFDQLSSDLCDRDIRESSAERFECEAGNTLGNSSSVEMNTISILITDRTDQLRG
jgi:hypothetical protein